MGGARLYGQASPMGLPRKQSGSFQFVNLFIDLGILVSKSFLYLGGHACFESNEIQAVFLGDDGHAVFSALSQEARFSGHPMEEAQRQTVLALESELWRRTWEQANILRRIKLKYILFL